MTHINRDEWMKALEDANLQPDDDQSAITVAEFAAMFDLHHVSADRRLRKLAELGKAVKTRKRCPAVDGRRVFAVAYKLL